MEISRAKSFHFQILCLLLVLTLLMQPSAECKTKVYNKKDMAFKNGGAASVFPSSRNFDEMPEDWELRRVPAGPDPLHHNGHTPTKPQTP